MGLFSLEQKPPGVQLEEDVAKWLEGELLYDVVKRNELIPGTSSNTPHEFDVVAVRMGKRKGGLVVVIALIAAFIFVASKPELTSFFNTPQEDFLVVAAVFFLAAGGILTKRLPRKEEETVYVECKEWKQKVGRPIVSQVVGRMQEFGDAERREEGSERWMIVSSSGFTRPALETAKAYGIQCVTGAGKHFERVQ